MSKNTKITLGALLTYLGLVLLVFLGSGDLQTAFGAPLIAFTFIGLLFGGLSLIVRGATE